MLVVPGRSVNRLLKVNDPVGDGGWMTLRRSSGGPLELELWRPFSHVNGSAIPVTLVLGSRSRYSQGNRAADSR